MTNQDFEVESVPDGEEGLAKVDELDPSCVLLDIRIPKINGVECLKKLRKTHPKLPIFMITGIDHDELKEGCLKAGAKGYFKKPIDFESLLAEINSAISIDQNGHGHASSKEGGGLNAIDIVDDVVASPPTIYHQLQQAIDDPESGFNDFEKIISNDPALSARLLKVVNSPFYGLGSKVSTITHALNIVGTDQLADLALATGVLTQFKGIPKDVINMDSFWKHSIAVGLGARIMAKHLQVKDVEKFYLAGMLHDLGSLILFKEAPEKMKKILDSAIERKTHLFEEEDQFLNFTHAEVGQNLLKKWDLPKSLIEGVAFHHNPLEATKHKTQALIVHIADSMAYKLELGASGEPQVPQLSAEVLEEIGLTEDDLNGFEETLTSEFNEVSGMFV